MRPLRFRLQASIKQFSLVLLSLTCLLLFAHISQAHEGKPAVAIFNISDDGLVNIDLTADLEAMIAGIGPDHSDGDFAKAAKHLKLRKMSPSELTLALNDFTATLLAGIEVRADDTLLITSLEGSDIPESDNPLNARESVIKIRTKLPNDAKTISWQWKKDFGVIALRLHSPSKQDVFNGYLEPGVRSDAFDLTILQD
jgi:hypothetical protein